MKKLVSITCMILACIIIAVLAFHKAERVELPKAESIDISHQPHLGHGKVIMVAFEDMKCSNCKIYNERVYPYLKSQYIDSGKATYVVVPLAFLPHSSPAGNAALCVDEQNPRLFFDYVEYLYQHQPNEALDWANAETLIDFANHITGINSDQLKTCIEDHRYDTRLQENLALASHVMGDTVQTPTLYIDGYLVSPISKERIDQIMRARD